MNCARRQDANLMSLSKPKSEFLSFNIASSINTPTEREPMNHGSRSIYLDFVGKNREIRGIHDGVLSQLLGIVRMRLPSQNKALVAPEDFKGSDFAQEATLQVSLQLVQIRNRLDVTL